LRFLIHHIYGDVIPRENEIFIVEIEADIFENVPSDNYIVLGFRFKHVKSS
jgi:hypothetical protein